jgi:hypothetical protein
VIGLLILGQLIGGMERLERGDDLHWQVCDRLAPDEHELLPNARCRRLPGGGTVVPSLILRVPDDFKSQAMGSVPWVPTQGPSPDSADAKPSTWVVATPHCERCDRTLILAELSTGALDCGRAEYPDWRQEAIMVDCFIAAQRRAAAATMRFDGIGFDVLFAVNRHGEVRVITISNDAPCQQTITEQECSHLPENPSLRLGCAAGGRPKLVCDERPSTRWSYSAPRPASELFAIEPGYRRFFAENGVRIVCTAAWGKYSCVPDWVWAHGLGGDAGVP